MDSKGEKTMQETIIEKSDTNAIRVGLNEYEGHEYVDIRLMFRNDNSDKWLPSKKGVTVPLTLLPEFRKAVASLPVPHEAPREDR